MNTAQDRFYNTDLDKLLKAKGITTMIMVGWKISGSVTYTSVGAMMRDYTVVIPVDTTAAATDYETAIGFYNVLNSGQRQPGERAFEAEIRNAEPHRLDHFPISDRCRAPADRPGRSRLPWVKLTLFTKLLAWPVFPTQRTRWNPLSRGGKGRTLPSPAAARRRDTASPPPAPFGRPARDRFPEGFRTTAPALAAPPRWAVVQNI